jgi:TPR repeat protein
MTRSKQKDDFNPAVSWYRKAADQGLSEAQHNLGLMYASTKAWRRITCRRISGSTSAQRQEMRLP